MYKNTYIVQYIVSASWWRQRPTSWRWRLLPGQLTATEQVYQTDFQDSSKVGDSSLYSAFPAVRMINLFDCLLGSASYSTTSVTSMSLLTTVPCPLSALPQPLSPPCLSSQQSPVHWVLFHNLCHLHVSPHNRALSIECSSTTSVTSMSLLTTEPCPLSALPQPLSPPCLSSQQSPVHWVLFHNLCHLHVSPHNRALSIECSSTTSVTSMSLLTTEPCPLSALPQPLSPPCLSSQQSPVHWVLFHNLCHLHVSPHNSVCPLRPLPQPLSPPCLSSQQCLSIASSSTTSVTSMSLLTTVLCPQPLSPPCLSSQQCSSTTSVTSMSLLTTVSVHNLCHLLLC